MKKQVYFTNSTIFFSVIKYNYLGVCHEISIKVAVCH